MQRSKNQVSRFYGSNDLTNSVKALKEGKVLRIRLQSQEVHPNITDIQYESMPSEMGHVRQPNPENCSSKCGYDCAQYNTEQFL